MSLQSLFYPQATAVIGSMTPGKLGWVLLRQMLDGGYEGKLFAVNPKAQGAFEVAGFASVAEIGKPVDLAVIASPAATVKEVMEDCGRAGVGAAVVITSGFSEMGNQAGEDEILETARRYNIRFVGPNCAGIVNTAHRLYPTLELHPPAGGVALVSQSGALGGVVLAWAREQGLGISKFVSYGNGPDLSQVELLHYLADDPETKVVAVYIESVKDGRAFMAALEACSRVKPVVVIKAGRTGAGQRATASHTGSLAGSDAVYDAAFRQCGAVRVKSVEQMLDLCAGFLHLPPLNGRRIIIVTNSGGPGVLAADLAEELGLEVAEPSPAAIETLRSFLPAHCAFRNPIDLTVEGTESGYRRTLETVLPEFDAAVAMNICPPYLDSMGLARGVLDAANAAGKPLATNFIPAEVVANSVAFLKENGIPNFPSGERAVTVLSEMARYYLTRKKRSAQNSLGDSPHRMPEKLAAQPQKLPGSGQMLEPEAMSWLQENDIPAPQFRQAASGDEAVEACAAIGYPVVMKVVSPDILHKSDVGGVVVGIRDEGAARAAFEAMRSAARGKDFRGVVVYPMIKDAQEVLVGLSHDPQFGPVVAFGLGGIYTEIWRDVVLRIAPVGLGEAREMIGEIRSIRLLQGARGRKPCDLEALARMLVNFSQLPFRYPEIGEIDLNPVFLMPDGLVIGDVRVIRKS